MTRIEKTFESLRQRGRKALVGFLVAGDPDMGRSERDCREALSNGVDILELGVPFSDPTADGPVIQSAAQRSLAAGTTVAKVLALAARLRRDFEQPIVLFGYANPFYSYGYPRLVAEAAGAGVDAFLVVDLPYEESDELKQDSSRAGVDFISLIAPTTPEERLAVILDKAGGFIYYIMVKGVTGVRSEVATDVAGQLDRVRRCSPLPIVAGFGVSNAEQARLAAREADGIVVGSALVQAAREGTLVPLVRQLRAGLDSA